MSCTGVLLLLRAGMPVFIPPVAFGKPIASAGSNVPIMVGSIGNGLRLRRYR